MTVIAPQVSTVRTLPELLAFRVAQSPQGEAYREFNAKTGQWVSTCWDAFSEHVTHRRQALVAMLLPNGL
ncbi:MAG: long-chain fatty acid--CoA ligase, partial [Polaromonas sp.]